MRSQLPVATKASRLTPLESETVDLFSWGELPVTQGTAEEFTILDMCCGGKSFWFNPLPRSVLFGDIRNGDFLARDSTYATGERAISVRPGIVFDYTSLPFGDCVFSMVVFDPPHFWNMGKESILAKKYGQLPRNWKPGIRAGFAEAFRVLDLGGILIFKWNEDQIPVSEILECCEYIPLLGHKSGRASKTHSLTFLKTPSRKKHLVSHKIPSR